MPMTPFLRRLHYLNIGVQLAGMVLFASVPMWPYVIWSAVFGAISSAALYGERAREDGE